MCKISACYQWVFWRGFGELLDFVRCWFWWILLSGTGLRGSWCNSSGWPCLYWITSGATSSFMLSGAAFSFQLTHTAPGTSSSWYSPPSYTSTAAVSHYTHSSASSTHPANPSTAVKAASPFLATPTSPNLLLFFKAPDFSSQFPESSCSGYWFSRPCSLSFFRAVRSLLWLTSTSGSGNRIIGRWWWWVGVCECCWKSLIFGEIICCYFLRIAPCFLPL